MSLYLISFSDIYRDTVARMTVYIPPSATRFVIRMLFTIRDLHLPDPLCFSARHLITLDNTSEIHINPIRFWPSRTMYPNVVVAHTFSK